MSRLRVSIVTPTYNHERFIAECIESVMAQTYDDWEMLLVDDGSTDHTGEIAQAYAAQDERIRLLHQPNKGIWRLAETYNSALEQASGDLIAVLEGDDYWPSDKLALQVGLHQQQPDLIMSHGRVIIAKHGQNIGEYCRPKDSGLLATEAYLRMALLSESCIMPVSVCVRKTALQAIGGFHQDPGFPAVDYSTWVRLFNLPGQAIWVSRVLGYWRQGTTQATQVHGVALAEAALKIAQNQFDQLPPDVVTRLELSRSKIAEAHYRTRITPSYLSCVREALLKRDRRSAVGYAVKLIRHGDIKRQLQGAYALLAALGGLNMEPILSAYEALLWRRRQVR